MGSWKPPAKIEELFGSTAGGNFSGINAPTAGARSDSSYPGPKTGPLQLYSLATPNGHKVGILLEELGIPYDAHVVNIRKGEQFSTGFVKANPNSKIPAAIDFDGPGGQPISLFESASIMYYLCKKHGRFLPEDPRLEQECMNWLFWQMAGQGPMSGNFGHFMLYAPDNAAEARDYGVARYGMETMRLADVLDQHLQGICTFTNHFNFPDVTLLLARGAALSGRRQGRIYIVGEQYTVADMACMPWALMLFRGYKHSSGIAGREFLSSDRRYPNVKSWIERLLQRPAVQRGLRVCSSSPKPWLTEQIKWAKL